MTNQTIPPCPVCGTVPKYSSTVVDYGGSITCILLVPLCTCLIDARRIGGEISTNQWDQLCSEYLGRACRELGIETVEQLKTRLDKNKNLLNNNEDLPMDNIIQIAKLCHELNRAYCQAIGDNSQASWDDAPLWQKESAIKGVQFHLDNPGSPPSASHESWLREKEATGWKYGPVKDADKKEHPCFIPYEQLPAEQKAKDYIFKAAVEFAPMLAPDPRVAVLGKVVYDLSVVASIAADVFSATDARNDLQNDALERLLYVLNDHRGIIAAQRGEG